LVRYFNYVLLAITQGYTYIKEQSFLEQNGFVNKLTISTNQTFRYIIDLKIAKKEKKLNI